MPHNDRDRIRELEQAVAQMSAELARVPLTWPTGVGEDGKDGESASGTGKVTVAIEVGSYDDATETLTYGKGEMRIFEESPNDLERDVLGPTKDVYTTDEEEGTPVDKIIHWKTVNGKKVVDVEPCD